MREIIVTGGCLLDWWFLKWQIFQDTSLYLYIFYHSKYSKYCLIFSRNIMGEMIVVEGCLLDWWFWNRREPPTGRNRPKHSSLNVTSFAQVMRMRYDLGGNSAMIGIRSRWWRWWWWHLSVQTLIMSHKLPHFLRLLLIQKHRWW